jgi:hypothetical protein
MNGMHLVALMSLLCCAACTDRSASTSKAQGAAAETEPVADNLLPRPTGPLTIRGEDQQKNQWSMTLEELIREMERITPVRFVVTQESRAVLGRIPVGNFQPIVVPVEKAWTVFEGILCEQNFVLEFVSQTEPVVLSVKSTMPQAGRGSGAASSVIEVPVADLPRWRAHPAFVIRTTIELPDTNVRDLSNSLRQVFTDPSSQQIVPIGNSQSLLVTGQSGSVVALVKALQGIDASERKRRESKAQQEQAQREKAAPSAAPK